MTAVQPPRVAAGGGADEVLHRVFGYDGFRGNQAEIIQQVVAGGDALVLMPTGGGKSLCYQIPAMVRAGTGVVVSPLIALMQDQVDALSAVGVRAAFLNSTQSPDSQGSRGARLPRRRARPPLPRPGATPGGIHHRPARPRAYLTLRHRRGALCVAVGSRLPARLPAPVGAARAVAGGSSHRAHGHGHREDARGDRRAAAVGAGATLRRELRSPEHPVPHRPQELAAAAGSSTHPHRACRGCRHHLLPVARLRGEDGRIPCGAGHSGAAVSRGPPRRGARGQSVALPPRRRHRDGRHDRVRYGNRQAGCSVRRPPRPAQIGGGVLPGDRAVQVGTDSPPPPGSPTGCKTSCSSAA